MKSPNSKTSILWNEIVFYLSLNNIEMGRKKILDLSHLLNNGAEKPVDFDEKFFYFLCKWVDQGCTVPANARIVE